MNGLCSKHSFLIDFIRTHKLDIACVNESHLLSHIGNSFVSIPNYVLLHNDSAGTVYKHDVCAFVHNSIAVGD